jgi:hypothetical protein
VQARLRPRTRVEGPAPRRRAAVLLRGAARCLGGRALRAARWTGHRRRSRCLLTQCQPHTRRPPAAAPAAAPALPPACARPPLPPKPPTPRPPAPRAPQEPAPDAQPAAGSAQPMSTIDILESRAKSKRRPRPEAKVKVQSAIVDQATGKTASTPMAQAETSYVSALLFLFLAILVEGLLLAGAGFLPEDWDAFIQDVIYPSFSWTVLAFLGGSSLYGLFKTGKLPGQQNVPLE